MKKVLEIMLVWLGGVVLMLGLLWCIGFGNTSKMNPLEMLLSLVLACFGAYVCYIMTVAVHEFGHLVAGKISGYGFLNYRLFSINICKYEDGFKIKRFGIPGTGGQCLMAPPEYNEGKYKYKLYLAGGNIATFILMVVELSVAIIVGVDMLPGRIGIVSAVIALYLLVLNGIPMKVSGVVNDSYNIINLGDNEELKKEFWDSLDINAKNHNGLEYSEMGIDFDAIEDDKLLENIEGISIQIKLAIKLNYLICTKQFEEAYSLCKKLLGKKEVVELYKCEFRCDKMFLEIMLGKEARVKKTYSESVKQYINKTHKYMLQRMRLMYAYYLLIEKDEAKALEEKKCFEKISPRYPDLGEIKSESKLMEYIEALHIQRIEEAKKEMSPVSEEVTNMEV